MATLRIEFLDVQQSNSELFGGADNVVSGRMAPSVDAAITGSALTGNNRVSVPSCKAVRVTPLGSAAYIEWGGDPTATQANSIRLADGQSETYSMKKGHKISAMTAS